MKNVLFISFAVMFFSSACGDIHNDLWNHLSNKITSDKQITSFEINGYKARISGLTVNSVLPYGTSVKALKPKIIHNGDSISPESGESQDFTSPVSYTVTASDGTTAVYIVSVKVLTSAEMSNADLAVLNVKKGRLQPAFSSGIFSYLDAPVPFSDSASPAYNDKQSNSMIADPEILIAKMTINGVDVENGTEHIFPEIEVGPNPVAITVISVDKTTTKTYNLNMYRAIPVFKTGAGSYSGINPLEDGATRRGVSWPAVRFTNNGDGTVTDNMTGLMWLKDAKKISTAYAFEDAVSHSQNDLLPFADYYDWYLPNISEMRSLMNYGQIGYDYLSVYFDNCSYPEDWWSSTSSPENPSANACCFSLRQFFSSFEDSGKTSNFYVWAVRANSKILPKTSQTVLYKSGDDGDLEKGVDWPAPRFYKDTTGAIVDNMTSLMWFPSAGSTQKTWINSIDFIENTLNLDTLGSNLGYNDWMLPNSNELMTLMNYGKSDLCSWLTSYGFTLSSIVAYWTSTTGYISPSTNAFSVNFNNQNLLIFIKGTSYNFLPVRLIKPSEMLNY